MANEIKGQRELIVPPGSYVYTQDATKGVIKVYSGPIVVNPTAQEVPVVFDAKEGFKRVDTLEEAQRKSPFCPEGSYIVLQNPADEKHLHPDTGTQRVLDFELQIGSKVVIPGPSTFPLWPQQSAQVIQGHHLKSNQFLLVRIYNEKEAQKNWASGAVIRAATPVTTGEGAGTQQPPPETPPAAVVQKEAVELTTGKLHIIKGTEVSFYIPPTGVEVVEESQGKYVRDALTLEQMEYCILVDENGKKRYEKGPKVVFPLPTESFQMKDGAKKQTAIELNDLQGLHLKAIADKEIYGTKFKAGGEYFVTGAGTFNAQDEKIGPGVTIYYPCEELAFVRYDGKTKIFAVTVPEGEGRYVLNRLTGEITTEKGPKQLLPNPCKYVIVRKVLTPKQCMLFYPGNQEALDYNLAIAGAAAASPTTRAGALSEGDMERFAMRSTRGMEQKTKGLISASVMNYAGETSRVSGDQKVMGDEFERSSGYTAPRTLTLNTKYQGAVAISVWTGYAVQVVSRTGDRRVVIGPTTILLDYDEELEAMEVSTGKPKTTDTLLRIGYLRVENNKVSDIFTVETSDHVFVEVKVSYKINFTGDSSKWFSVENYVKFFCDHARSMVKGAVKKITVEEFYSNSTDIIRDILLGAAGENGRPGLIFTENGMRMDDLEVLSVNITDPAIQKLLAESQLLVVRTNVELSTAARNLEVTKKKETISREELQVRTETRLLKDELVQKETKSALDVELARLTAFLTQLAEEQKKAVESQKLIETEHQNNLRREKEKKLQEIEYQSEQQDLVIEKLEADTKAATERLNALKDGLAQALTALSDKDTLVKIAEAQSVTRIIESSDKVYELVKAFAEQKSLKNLLATNGVNGAAQTAAQNTART